MMLAVDAPPKTKQKPNKVKINDNRPLTNLKEQLRHELEAVKSGTVMTVLPRHGYES